MISSTGGGGGEGGGGQEREGGRVCSSSKIKKLRFYLSFAMRASLVGLFCLLSVASAFSVATPAMRPAAARAVATRAVASPNMVVDPSSIDASTLLALALPIPAYSPVKAAIMMFSNVLIIWCAHMEIYPPPRHGGRVLH
jgi:hypothetical protein